MELAKLTSGDVGRSLIMVREGLRMDGSPSGHSVTINITGLKAFSDAVKQAQVSVAQLGKTLNGLAVKSAIIDEFHVGGFHEDDGEDDDGAGIVVQAGG